MLSSIFRITVDPEVKTDRNGHKLAFLPELRKELSERNEALKLDITDLDSALNEAGSLLPNSKSLLDYFIPSWKNVMRALKTLRDTKPEKVAVLQEAKRLCMSNCIWAITTPIVFG